MSIRPGNHLIRMIGSILMATGGDLDELFLICYDKTMKWDYDWKIIILGGRGCGLRCVVVRRILLLVVL